MQTQAPSPGVFPAGATGMTADGLVSGVTWSAVLAGAAAAAALSFVLLILGFGLGLSAVSPWSYNDAAIGTSTIVWIGFMQLASAGVGGYIAGRLRVKWASVHNDEVYFRDTAHGMLAWAVATLLTAALMAGAMRSVIGGAVDAGAGVAAIAASAAPAAVTALAPRAAATGATANATGAASGTNSGASSGANPSGSYFSDLLLRSDSAGPDTDNGELRGEVGRILLNDLRAGSLPVEDREYLAGLVAKRTGLAQPDAERRVDDIYARMSKAAADAKARAKVAADQARKAAAWSALWMFVALLIGAFFASLCATFGGRQRDRAVLLDRA